MSDHEPSGNFIMQTICNIHKRVADAATADAATADTAGAAAASEDVTLPEKPSTLPHEKQNRHNLHKSSINIGEDQSWSWRQPSEKWCHFSDNVLHRKKTPPWDGIEKTSHEAVEAPNTGNARNVAKTLGVWRESDRLENRMTPTPTAVTTTTTPPAMNRRQSPSAMETHSPSQFHGDGKNSVHVDGKNSVNVDGKNSVNVDGKNSVNVDGEAQEIRDGRKRNLSEKSKAGNGGAEPSHEWNQNEKTSGRKNKNCRKGRWTLTWETPSRTPSWAAIIVAAALFLSSAQSYRGPLSHPCEDSSQTKMELQVSRAAVIMTGTVQRLHRIQGQSLYQGDVLIKRIIKGTKKDLDIGSGSNMILVTNFNDPKVCKSRIYQRDTKIFMFNLPLVPGQVSLNSSILRINLFNLFKVQAIVDGTKFEPPKMTPAKKCDIQYCAFGAKCEYNATTDEAKCVCSYECTSVFTPVCGSDNATYENECALRKTKCVQQRRILEKHRGPCNIRDPCAEKKCGFGAKCESSLDGKSARCVCPEDCMKSKVESFRSSNPVCGNDGVDYKNVCELRRSSCLNHREIHVKYLGKCDPCKDSQCGQEKVCQLNEYRKPMCRCRDDCSDEDDFVCGSDGKTYRNECGLRVEACRKRREIRVIARGRCTTLNNPCHEIRCHIGAECHVDRNGIEQCICPPSCEPVLRHVCGTDGNTYDNRCELERAVCIQKKAIEISSQGPCGVVDPCANYGCNFGAICVVREGKGLGCECPTCSEEFDAVCGSDGLSYTNACKLKLESCEQRKEVTVKHSGLCNQCRNVKCEFYAICESRGLDAQPQCVCPSSCVQVDAYVCGSDAVTYINECELRVASCKHQKHIEVVSQGRCDACANIRCGYGAVCKDGICECPPCSAAVASADPLCGSDGVTYKSRCELRYASCILLKNIRLSHPGECGPDGGEGSGSGDLEIGSGDGADAEDGDDDDDVCDDSNCRYGGICESKRGRITCTCDFDCIENFGRRVCGTDGRVHRSSCHMRERSCKKQTMIVEQDMDNCQESDEDDKDEPEVPGANRVNCATTRFGCCPEDGASPARGPNGAGCPAVCRCNKLGSYDATCDPSTKQCSCKPGVGGLQCDRCEPGFWGLPKIAEGNSGCIPCDCSLFGSERDDCEQMTGRCVCKAAVTGMKCDKCENGRFLAPEGCSGEKRDVTSGGAGGAGGTTMAPRSCSFLTCPFGAKCQVKGNRAECVCDGLCEGTGGESDKEMVCGSDGETYGSACTLKTFACRLQKKIHVEYEGKCRSDAELKLFRRMKRRKMKSLLSRK